MAADLAAAFAGLADGVAVTSATFLVAGVVFGAVGAAVLGVAAVLLFVLTVLAFSVLGEDAGAGDFATAVAFTAADWAAPDFASGFGVTAGEAAEGTDFFGLDSADAGFFWARAGEIPPFAMTRDTSFVSASGAFFASDGSAFSIAGKGSVFPASAETDGDTLIASVALGSSILGFAISAFAATGGVQTAFAPELPCTFASRFLAPSRRPASVFLAAASISEDVITTRFGEAMVFDTGTVDVTGAVALGDAGLAADLVLSATEAAERAVVLADPDVFFPNFPEAFCLETAIVSTSKYSGYRPEIMLQRNITLDGITHKGQEHFSDNPSQSPPENLYF